MDKRLETLGIYNIRERFYAVRDKEGNFYANPQSLVPVYDSHKSTTEPIHKLDVGGPYFSFEPFRIWDEEQERWRFLAIYTPTYLSARVMDLESGEVLAKTSDHKLNEYQAEILNKHNEGKPFKEGDSYPSFNFCIADIHVPDFFDIHKPDGEGQDKYDEFTKEFQDYPEVWADWMEDFLDLRTFGFVSGCIWGDDYLFKIQTINLQNIFDGKMELEESFGYFPFMGDLKDAYDPSYFEGESRFLDMKATVGFEMKKNPDTGKRVGYVHYTLPDDIEPFS